jgi:hypothetical protein
MRKTVPYVAAWFVAGVAAVALASAGVAAVGQQVTGSRPAPLSANEVRELAADGTSTTTTTTASPTTTAPRTATTTAPGAGSGGSGPTGTGSSGTPGGGSPTTTPTTAPPPPPPAPTTRTYNLIGGTATLQFSSTGVKVLVAAPNAGFSVEVSETHGTGARVEFETDEHKSRVDAWWDDGPQDEVREDT